MRCTWLAILSLQFIGCGFLKPDLDCDDDEVEEDGKCIDEDEADGGGWGGAYGDSDSETDGGADAGAATGDEQEEVDEDDNE